MHIEFLVEELSAEAALLSIVPKILGHEVSFAIHSYQGKQDLLKKLPGMLTAYNAWLPEDWRICVLIDADEENCKELKSRLEGFAQNTGLLTKTATSGASNFQVLNRVAVEELEAWFFGDVEALHAAYPRVSLTLGNKAKYRDPDTIKGGTWETLERVLKRLGYYSSGLPKITAAREISVYMQPKRNRSRSFQVFREGLIALAT